MENDESIELKCTIEKNGDINCKVSKETFDEIQREEIKPNRIIWDIEPETQE